jgi:CRP/FNR family transcriptional regulator
VISEITDFSPDTVRCFSNIESTEESVILSINKNRLLELCDEYPLLYKRLLSAFSTKSKLMQCLINRELVYDGTAKVAYTLLYETEMFAKVKKQEIAYMLNIQPETLSRILKKFERKEIIRLESKRAVILDRAALEKVLE